MILALRFIGVLNAAVWLGSMVFFTFGVGRAFFFGAIKQVPLHEFWPGVMAQLVLERYFYLQQLCGVVAVVHLVAEWFYLGRPLQKFNVALLTLLLAIGFVGGFWLQPKLKRHHLVMYGMNEQYQRVPLPDSERAAADKSFRIWHRVAMSANLLALAGLVVYFWRVTHPSDDLRVLQAGSAQFRS